MSKGIIFDIKEFAVHDGMGVRTTVFLKGCPLSCIWCHNPEGQSVKPEIMQKSGCENCGRCRKGCNHPECQPFGRCLHACPKGLLSVAGREIDSEELTERISRDAELYIMSGGGITFSGGEPLMQHEFLYDCLTLLGKKGLNRAIETSAFCSSEIFTKILSQLDFVYCDLKLADSDEHRKYTGVGNDQILKNIDILRQSGVKYRLRCPLIPGITDTEKNISAIKAMTREGEIEFLPYNKLAGAKYAMLGRRYELETL